MKAISNIIICGLMIIASNAFAQIPNATLKVKVQSGYLNMRKEPSIDAAIVTTMEKDAELLFQMEIRNGWLLVNYWPGGNDGKPNKIFSGWVNSDYVENPNLDSSILDTTHNKYDFGTYFNSAKGTILTILEEVPEKKEAIVYSEGRRIILTKKTGCENTYSGEGIAVEVIVFETSVGYESSSYTGFIRIEKADKVEYVFVNGEWGV